MTVNGPFLFVILDGFGVREERTGNAIAQSRTPFFDYLSGKSSNADFASAFGEVSYTTLTAVGPAVGMPEGAKGSTAVGHEVLSGVDYKHPMYLIEEAIKDGVMLSPVIDDAINYAREHASALHLMGLISDNREQSDIRHLYAIMRRAVNLGQKKIILHFFTDGRGTPPQSASGFLKDLRAETAIITDRGRLCNIRIATVGGRDMTLNRNAAYCSKTVATFRAIVQADAPRVESIDKALEAAYALGERPVRPHRRSRRLRRRGKLRLAHPLQLPPRPRRIPHATFRRAGGQNHAAAPCLRRYDLRKHHGISQGHHQWGQTPKRNPVTGFRGGV